MLVLDCTEDGPKGAGKGEYVTEQFFDPLVLLDSAKDTPMKQKATVLVELTHWFKLPIANKNF